MCVCVCVSMLVWRSRCSHARMLEKSLQVHHIYTFSVQRTNEITEHVIAITFFPLLI